MFGVQFLLFPVSTSEEYYGRILMTFSGLVTTGTGLEQAKFENRAWMTPFCNQNIP